MPMCTDGKNDMFYPSPWNEAAYTKECKATYNVEPQFDLPRKEYGGKELSTASNIVFRSESSPLFFISSFDSIVH